MDLHVLTHSFPTRRSADLIGGLAAPYRHLHRRHWRDDQPFLLTDVYIDERLRDRVSRGDVESKTALRLINDIPGLEIADARQTLAIGTSDMETARELSMQLNAPVAFVHPGSPEEHTSELQSLMRSSYDITCKKTIIIKLHSTTDSVFTHHH